MSMIRQALRCLHDAELRRPYVCGSSPRLRMLGGNMKWLFAALAAAIILFPARLLAAPVVVTFAGTLSEATDPAGQLGVAAGSNFSGSFTYESTTPVDPSTGDYLGALTAGTITVDGNVFTFDLAGTNQIEVANDAPLNTLLLDVFQVEASLSPAFGYDDLLFVFSLADATLDGTNPDALDSTTLPTAFDATDFPPFALVDQFVITLAGLHPPEERLRLAGDLSSLNAVIDEPGATPVPEPSTAALILVSLILAVLLTMPARAGGRRRSRSCAARGVSGAESLIHCRSFAGLDWMKQASPPGLLACRIVQRSTLN